MKQSKPQTDIGLKVGDRVKLIAKTLAWKAEMTLQDKIGEVIERRDDGQVSILYDNGKLLMGRAAEPFELVSSLGRRQRGNNLSRDTESPDSKTDIVAQPLPPGGRIKAAILPRQGNTPSIF